MLPAVGKCAHVQHLTPKPLKRKIFLSIPPPSAPIPLPLAMCAVRACLQPDRRGTSSAEKRVRIARGERVSFRNSPVGMVFVKCKRGACYHAKRKG